MQAKLKALCLLCFFLVLSQIDNALAWTERAVYHSPENPGKCTINEFLVLSPGDTAKSPSECANITCETEKGMAVINGCSLFPPPPNCSWGDLIDMSAPFPECCAKRLVCANPENQTTAEAYENDVLDMFKREREQEWDDIVLVTPAVEHKEL